MANEWCMTILGELCDFRAGSVFKPALQGRASGEYPFVKVSDMNLPANAVRIQDANNWVSREDVAELRAKPFPPGTVVFAKIGEALRQNRLRQVARQTLIDNNMMGAIPRVDRVDARYFYYALSQFDFAEIAQGTALPYLTVAALSNLSLEVPPLKEQRAIAHILGALDDKIELNRKQNETLEAMARALFKDWFVDFGPVRAKMEGREPYLPADLWQLFPDRLDDEGKPEGWRSATLASFASLNPESWTKKNAPDDIRYVDLSNTKQGNIEGTARMPWSEAPSRAQRILRPGDTIVGTVRPGNKSFALIGDDGMTGSTGFAVLRPLHKHSRDFVFLAATSPENIERLTHLADGAAYPAVRPDVVLASPVTVPPGEIVNNALRSFANAVSGWVDAVEKNKQESKTLAQLRDTLLPKLISGELRIVEAENLMEAIV